MQVQFIKERIPTRTSTKVRKTCRNCGKEFERIPSIASRVESCSMACRDEWNKKNPRPKPLPNKTCVVCGKAFLVKPNRLEEARCCSWECGGKHKTADAVIELECQYCHKKYTIIPSQTKRGRAFCSQSCSARARIAITIAVGKRNRTHGMSGEPEYISWLAAKKRCDDPTDQYYAYYGERGIEFCNRWRKFEHFYADMGSRPGPKYSLERIDVNGNYEPNNCKWATATEQARNKRTNINLEFGGKLMCQELWAKETGIPRTTIYNRLKAGWPIEKILTTPPWSGNGKLKLKTR